MRQFLLATATAVAFLGLAAAAQAAELTRVGPPDGMIAQAVVAPPGSTTVYVSGITPPAISPQGAPAAYGDTKTQTIGVLTRIQDILKTQNMTMGDVVMLRVYLTGDPAKDGKMDFAGMNEGYRQFFANANQPNKPARITMQIAALVNPAFLVEIEAQAVKAP
jgi:enamine deaminase RidA (YjgF/YER057c/UK114 family)